MRNLKLVTFSFLLIIVCAGSSSPQTSTIAIVPMQMRGLMPVVEVRLNGQGPFAFMIDTGAGMQADIDISVAQRLNLRANGRVINGDPSGENDREVVTAKIDSITFGPGASKGRVEFRDVIALVRPQRITKDYPNVDGILGFALFTEYL